VRRSCLSSRRPTSIRESPRAGPVSGPKSPSSSPCRWRGAVAGTAARCARLARGGLSGKLQTLRGRMLLALGSTSPRFHFEIPKYAPVAGASSAGEEPRTECRGGVGVKMGDPWRGQGSGLRRFTFADGRNRVEDGFAVPARPPPAARRVREVGMDAESAAGLRRARPLLLAAGASPGRAPGEVAASLGSLAASTLGLAWRLPVAWRRLPRRIVTE
jgi:hypothetical protein